jgi:formylglycine-generating enzyme required for sulfatase activity
VIDHDVELVLRGGSFSRRAVYERSAARYWNHPVYRYINVGLRVARTYP